MPPQQSLTPNLSLSRRNWSRILGLLGTLALHGAISLFVLNGSASPPPKSPIPQGAGVSTILPPAEELVLLTLTAFPIGDPGLSEQIASLGTELETLHIPSVSPSSLATFDVPPAEEAATAGAQNPGDAVGRALMFGRYLGQIRARIERAWITPPTPMGEGTQVTANSSPTGTIPRETFTCRVQIRQDSRGNVQEVLLLNCPGTEAWRHSLVVAINQSSPLPAPPTPVVFAALLNMTFDATIGQTADKAVFYRVASSAEPNTAAALTREPPLHPTSSVLSNRCASNNGNDVSNPTIDHRCDRRVVERAYAK